MHVALAPLHIISLQSKAQAAHRRVQKGQRASLDGLAENSAGGAARIEGAPYVLFAARAARRGPELPRIAIFRLRKTLVRSGFGLTVPLARTTTVRTSNLTEADKVQWPLMTGQAVSGLVGFSPRWLLKLEEQGFVKRRDDRLFEAGATLLGYVRFLEEAKQRNAGNAETQNKLELQARNLEIDNARRLDGLIEYDVAKQLAAEILSTLRTCMILPEDEPLMPGDVRQLLPEVRRRHEAAFDRAEKKLEKAFVDLKTSVPAMSTDDEDLT